MTRLHDVSDNGRQHTETARIGLVVGGTFLALGDLRLASGVDVLVALDVANELNRIRPADPAVLCVPLATGETLATLARLDPHVEAARADTAEAGVDVVRFELHKPHSHDEILTQGINGALERARQDPELYFVLDSGNGRPEQAAEQTDDEPTPGTQRHVLTGAAPR